MELFRQQSHQLKTGSRQATCGMPPLAGLQSEWHALLRIPCAPGVVLRLANGVEIRCMSDLLREKNKRLILQELTAEIAFHEKRKSAR